MQRKAFAPGPFVEEETADVGDVNAGIALSLTRNSPRKPRKREWTFNLPAQFPTGSPAFVCLLVVWMITLLWGEFLVFHLTFVGCRWPSPHSSITSQFETTHVALIADPQLTDQYSYRFTSEGGTLARVIQFYSDLYMRRNLYLLQKYMTPSHVFVLGDLLDSTKRLTDEEYGAEVARYRQVFKLIDPDTLMYSISGNHDVGFQIANVAALTDRYETEFGPINDRVTVGQFDFVLLSSASLEMKEWDQRSYERTNAFLHNIGNSGVSAGLHPRILLSHVPLWRPRTASCGPLRQNSPQIPNCKGYSYKCLIGESNTRKIIDEVRPLYVFSGDDHDQCVVLHSSTEPTTSFFTQANDDLNHGSNDWNPFHQWDTTFYSTAYPPEEEEETSRVTAGVARTIDSATGPIRVSLRRIEDLPGPEDKGGGQGGGKAGAGKGAGIPEQTVGTFSFLQGNSRPSFALLSLHSAECAHGDGDVDGVDADRNNDGEDEKQPRAAPGRAERRKCTDHRLEVDVCFLPRQLLIYAWYGVLASVSVAVLFGYHLRQRRSVLASGVLPGPPLPVRSTNLRQTTVPLGWWRCLVWEFAGLLTACLSLHMCLVVSS